MLVLLAACSGSFAQQPLVVGLEPTSAYLDSLNIVLLDTNVRYVCYPVYEANPWTPVPSWTPNNHPIFLTATAINATRTAEALLPPPRVGESNDTPHHSPSTRRKWRVAVSRRPFTVR